MSALRIISSITIPEDEILLSAIRAQGAGGQNVNKVSSAIHLRFNIHDSSLPAEFKERLLVLNDRRITSDGVIIIKAQRFRTREKNRQDALLRLQALLSKAAFVPKVRKATHPSKGSQIKRLDSKKLRGKTKALRGKVLTRG